MAATRRGNDAELFVYMYIWHIPSHPSTQLVYVSGQWTAATTAAAVAAVVASLTSDGFMIGIGSFRQNWKMRHA